MCPSDIVRRLVEMVGARRGKTRQNRVDFRLMGDECRKGFAVIWGFSHRKGSILVKPYCSESIRSQAHRLIISLLLGIRQTKIHGLQSTGRLMDKDSELIVWHDHEAKEFACEDFC